MLRCVVLFVFGLPCLSFAVACCLICVCVGGLLARLGWCWTVRGYAWLGVLVQVGYLLLVAWWGGVGRWVARLLSGASSEVCVSSWSSGLVCSNQPRAWSDDIDGS